MASRKGVTAIQLEMRTWNRLMDFGKKIGSHRDMPNRLIDFPVKGVEANVSG